MKTIICILLTWSAFAFAQSTTKQAVLEQYSIAPRCQRGDLQKYELRVDYYYLDEAGIPKALKKNKLLYEQLCLSNNPDSGLVYEITLGQFRSGLKGPVKRKTNRSSLIDGFEGINFKSLFSRRIPSVDSCYDIGIPIPESMHYVEGYELLENYIPIKLLEQLRYTAGTKLSYIGDTTTIALPGPISFQIPNVINNYQQDQTPITLKLAGITKRGSIACILVQLTSDIAPLQIEIYSTDTSSFKIEGSSWLFGEFLLTLARGEIVSASLTSRVEGMITMPDSTTRTNRVMQKFELRQNP